MPVGAEEEAPLGDFIEDAEATDAESVVISGLLQDDLRRVLATLEEREQNVIRLRYRNVLLAGVFAAVALLYLLSDREG
jgi:RNA polymerase nonessential primary-like sigma factor